MDPQETTTTRKVAITARAQVEEVVVESAVMANSLRLKAKVHTRINITNNITSKRKTMESKTKLKTWSSWSSNRIKFSTQIKINESSGDQLIYVDPYYPSGIINNWTAPWLGSKFLTQQLSMVSVWLWPSLECGFRKTLNISVNMNSYFLLKLRSNT